MSNIFSGDSVSIAVIPEEKLLTELEPIIREWLSEGLLSPFLIVTPQGVITSPGEPPIINARVLVPDSAGIVEEISEDTFKILAETEFKVVRLVGLRALRKDTTDVGEHNKVLATIINYISNALPQPSATANELEIGTRLLKINLVVAPSELQSSDYHEAFEGPWNMHVVASAEDRSTPWTADALVKDDERFKKFMLMHLSSTAALWNGLPKSPFELVQRDKAIGGSIWLSRVFVSAILTEGLARRVAAKTVKSIADFSSDLFESKIGIYISGTQIIPEDLIDFWVDWMVEQVFGFEDGALAFQQPNEGEMPKKERWYELTQIKHFFIFAWDKLKVIPWWIWIWIRRSIGRGLQRAFQGDEGLAEIGIDQNDPMDNRDKLVAYKLVEIKNTAASAQRALVAPLQRKSWRTSPILWEKIRRIIFGMLDGSDLSDIGVTPTEGRVPVFGKTSQVIQDPKEKFVFEAELRDSLKLEEISWKNLDSATEVLQKFDVKMNEFNLEMNETLDKLVQINKELEDLGWEGANGGR